MANVFLRLCEETSVTPALLNAALPALGKEDAWWAQFDAHRGLRKRVLESSRLKDTIRAIDQEC